MCTDASLSMPTCLLHTWVGNIQFSPHQVAVDGVLTATVMNIAGIGTSSMQMSTVPPGVLVSGPKSYCSGAAQFKVAFKASGTFTCSWKMTAATGGWTWGSVNICGDYGCALFEDYYGVGGPPSSVIQGTVERKAVPADNASTKLVPAAGVKVSIGTDSAKTDARGRYSDEISNAGTYSVSAAGYCVKGVNPCVTSQDVKVPGGGTVDFAQPTEPGISGAVEAVACGTGSCTSSPLQGVKVLVTGKASDGSTVTRTDATDAKGTWSVTVPKGSYTAGPTADGSTFIGPAFDPEKKQNILVGTNDVPDVNFRACVAEPGASRSTASAARTARASVTGVPSFCESKYTLSVTVSMPQRILVDPSPSARYNPSADPAVGTYRSSADKNWIAAGTRDLLRLNRQFPECLSSRRVAQLNQAQVENIEWYSYIEHLSKENSLFKLDLPLVWDQRASPGAPNGTVSYTPQTETMKVWKLTRVIKYRYTTKVGRKTVTGACSETHAVDPMEFLHVSTDELPGAGKLASNEFSLVVAWTFPFDPPGLQIDTGSAAGSTAGGVAGAIASLPAKAILFFLDGISSITEEFGTTVIPGYRAMPEGEKLATDLAIGFFMGEGGVKAIQGAAAAAATFAGEGSAVLPWLERTATFAERLDQGHKPYEVLKAGSGWFAGPESWPVMAAIVRGTFDREKVDLPGPAPAIYGPTTLGISVLTSRFPTIAVEVSREAFHRTDGQAVANGVLPWTTNTAGVPVSTSNPFQHDAGNPPYLVNDSTTNKDSTGQGKQVYTSGKQAMQNVLADATQTPTVSASIRESGGILKGFAESVEKAPEPACDKYGRSIANQKTICWRFQDGRP